MVIQHEVFVSVHTQSTKVTIKLTAKEGTLFVHTKAGQFLDSFDMDRDPSDYVTEAIVELVIDIFRIETSQQESSIVEEIGFFVEAFYNVRGRRVSNN